MSVVHLWFHQSDSCIQGSYYICYVVFEGTGCHLVLYKLKAIKIYKLNITIKSVLIPWKQESQILGLGQKYPSSFKWRWIYEKGSLLFLQNMNSLIWKPIFSICKLGAIYLSTVVSGSKNICWLPSRWLTQENAFALYSLLYFF